MRIVPPFINAASRLIKTWNMRASPNDIGNGTCLSTIYEQIKDIISASKPTHQPILILMTEMMLKVALVLSFNHQTMHPPIPISKAETMQYVELALSTKTSAYSLTDMEVDMKDINNISRRMTYASLTKNDSPLLMLTTDTILLVALITFCSVIW